MAQLLNALAADRVGGELCVEIPNGLIRNSDVGGHQALQRPAVPVPLEVVDRRRKDNALRVDIDGIRGKTRIASAQIQVVRYRTGESDQFAVHEDRREDENVLEVLAAPVRIIVDVEIPFTQRIGGNHVCTGPENIGHRAQLHGNQFSLGDDPPVPVEQRCRGILGFAHNIGIRGTDQLDSHFFPRGHQRLTDHRMFDRVQRGTGQPFALDGIGIWHVFKSLS